MMINLFGEESNRYTLLQANTPRTSPRSSYQNQNHNTNNNISQQSSAPGYFNYHQTHLTDQKRNGMPTRPLFRQMYHRFRYFSKSYPLVFRFFILLISTLILILIYSWLSDLPPGQIFSLTSVQINPKSVSSVNPKAQHNNPLPISNKLLKSSKSSTSHQSIKDSDSKTLIVSNSSLTTTVNGHDHGRNPVLVNEKMSSDSKTLLHSGSSHSTIPNLHSNQNPSSLSKPSSSSSSTLPSQSFVKITSSRPIVPHPLRPLPIPPPSSAKVCDRCGCSSDHQIKREFDQPDPLIINLNLVDHLSSSVSRSQSELFDPNQLSLVNKVWSSIRDVYCQHPMISSETSIELLDHSLPQSDKLLQTISLNLDSIKFGLPTQYIFTKTSQAGKTGSLRADYFRRHIRSITDHLVRLKKNGGRYLPETEAKWGNSPRQLVWLIIEDGEKLSESIRSVLENENGLIPYVYYVYGPTHRYGNAQQNSAYALIHRMVSYLGHGPVVSIDDDGKVLPELFDIVWRVRRLGVWPMGNLTPFKWEGPEYDEETHEFKDWLRSESDNRPFPLDNGAFAFSSQVFGTNHRLKGPRYWPTDYPGGESEFVSQILPRQDLVEPLCYNCRVAWHNQALKPDCVAHLPTCDEF